MIGLALYALTILVRSMLAGLAGVPEEVRESATRPGVRRRTRLLFRVELPLALPVIMAGLRVATVSTVALTTVGTLGRYGGLGNLIQDGVQNDFKAELLAASVLCVVLAFVLDALIVAVAVAADAVDARRRRHEEPPRDLGLPDRPAPTGAASDGIWTCWSSSCCSASRRCRRDGASALPIALWLGHLGRGGFLAINISNIGRAVPTFALLAILVTARPPRASATFGPYGRAGLATLIALTPVRAAADRHQRLRRGARGPGRGQGVRRAAWA